MSDADAKEAEDSDVATTNLTTPDDDEEEQEQDMTLPTIDEENANVSHRSRASSFDLDGYKASPHSAYPSYAVRVDHTANDRATEFKLCQFARPHMRAFHCAWFSFFLAFYVWFAVAPLLSEIQTSLSLPKKDIWTSSICSDATAILSRLIAGPLCDHVGARIPMAIFLGLASIPNFMVGLVNTTAGLCLVRFFIGVAGTTFVFSMYWGSSMFTKEKTGEVNGVVAGWGNAGGAFAQIIMGAVLFPAFTNYFDGDREKSWRTICVIPGAIGLAWSLVVVFISDDAPMGYYKEMKKTGTMDNNFGAASFAKAAWTDKNTWLLSLQYAACFGVELMMNNGASLYFIEEFGQTTESAAIIASLFGWMNLFARFAGGRLSDTLNLSYGMRGRLWLQSICLLLEGTLIVVFANMTSLGPAIAVMCIFSIFVQAAEGAVYGVVPYVSTTVTGASAGIVGAGGNIGGMSFAACFRQLSYKTAFLVMGGLVMGSSLLNLFVHIHGHAGLVTGKDSEVVVAARDRHRRRQSRLHEERRNQRSGGTP